MQWKKKAVAWFYPEKGQRHLNNNQLHDITYYRAHKRMHAYNIHTYEYNNSRVAHERQIKHKTNRRRRRRGMTFV